MTGSEKSPSECGQSRESAHLALTLLTVALLVVATAPRTALAQLEQAGPSFEGPYTYAVIVGSNPGGEGQAPLNYAEQDARRVGELLEELGRYPAQNLRVLTRPSPDQVIDALEALSSPLHAHQQAGEQAMLFFYYSGHARASAMNLGERELELSELRERLLSLPSTLTIVVLDACQSGAFSRTKGAVPAADFSFNSVSRLNTTGIAVMASSSASELSQESDVLGGSYFTHHLLVALRGGGDGNRDGRVSLDEAYRYAHDHTLADTSRTAVGGQHPTLETELTGRGDVPLTYPAEARAQIELPEELDGQVLIQKPSGGSVMAELYKAQGSSLLLAFPPGLYDVVLRGNGSKQASVRQCSLDLQDDLVATVRAGQCPLIAVEPAAAQAKGASSDGSPRDTGEPLTAGESNEHERWAVELTAGIATVGRDAYTERLDDFGFESSSRHLTGRFSLLGLYQVNQYLGLAVQGQYLENNRLERYMNRYDPGPLPYRFEWDAYALTFLPRGTLTLLDDWVALYAQLGLGLGLGFTHYYETLSGEDFAESFVGFRVTAGGGLQLNFWKYTGLMIDVSYDYAPIVRNLTGETRDSGGLFAGLGLRARIWR